MATENGEPSRMAGVHLNVSNIMDKLELHRSAHTALDRVISSAPVVIYTLQPKPPYYASYISDNLTSVLDVPVSDAGFGQVIRPCHEHELKHPSFATWVRNHQEPDLIRTYQAETRSGDIVWVRDYCHKVFHDGELRYISGALIDITDQVEQETILKQIASVSPGIIYQFIRYADGRMGFPFISERVKDIFNVPANHFRSDPVLSDNYGGRSSGNYLGRLI